ncbi:MAG: metal-dependent hydrolase [Patescibacteria group bacterium]|jgi:inner membrane protein
MTGRTHDLTAFTFLITAAYVTIPHITLATTVTALAAAMLGGIAPDLDQPTARLWNRLPAGSIIGRIIHPLLGSHRLISHSLFGMSLIGLGLLFLLPQLGTVLLVDMNVVWWAFMLGYLSHLVVDTITKEGVPWLFPIPIRLGIPPFKFLRLTTGGMIEKGIIFPGLLIFDGYLVYQHYHRFVVLFTQHVLK